MNENESKEKATTSTILNKLVENGVLVKIGNGPSTRYEINNNLKIINMYE